MHLALEQDVQVCVWEDCLESPRNFAQASNRMSCKPLVIKLCAPFWFLCKYTATYGVESLYYAHELLSIAEFTEDCHSIKMEITWKMLSQILSK